MTDPDSPRTPAVPDAAPAADVSALDVSALDASAPRQGGPASVEPVPAAPGFSAGGPPADVEIPTMRASRPPPGEVPAPVEAPATRSLAAGAGPAARPGLLGRPVVRTAFGGAVALVALVAMFGPALLAHARRSADPFTFNDDVRVQIYPFQHYKDPSLFPADYLGEYTLAAMASGYRLLYVAATWLWDAKAFSKLLPYVLLAVVAGAIAKGASRWGRVAAPFFAVALVLSSDAFFERMAGGLPRAFGFPIAACAAAALVHGRMKMLAAVTCLGAAFYPAAAMPGGMALALVTLVYRREDRGDVATWSLRRRLALVVGTAVVAAILLIPTSLALRRYGPYILERDVATYPEAGPGGRFYAGDRPPYPGLVDDSRSEARRALLGAGQRFASLLPGPGQAPGFSKIRDSAVYYLVGFAALGFLRLAFRDEGARRLLAFAVAAGIGHVLAARVAPWLYLPQRYSVFPIPVALCLMLPGAGSAVPLFFGRRGDKPWLRAGAVLCMAAVCLFLVGGRGSETAGLTVRIDPKAKLYPFLATLPADALIAGWPQTMDSVPYLSARQALVTMECHVAFNAGYVEEMRRRMRAILDAYLATDRAPLARLRDDLHVTHLLVDTRHFVSAPTYFRPFDRWVREAWGKGKAAGFEVPRLAKEAAVFSEGPLVLIDLSRVAFPSVPAALAAPATP